jgi:hypothetical protein
MRRLQKRLTLPVSERQEKPPVCPKTCAVARPLQWVVRPGVECDVARTDSADIGMNGNAIYGSGKESLTLRVNFGH